ncbi:CPBP family intramembrane glutamic endopeptidase [Rathayibacter sp. KR2-224]|uniref:CPBP family intramembrane glutamic endopeptidase n=1 Tax=Rathayibacter sp. KR2-224 TaxID=3400913 RepID=UPI003C00125D
MTERVQASGTPFPVRVPWLAVGTFVVIAFGLAWLITLPLWVSGSGLATPGAILLIVGMMYTPAAAALVVSFFVQRPRPRPLAEYLGLWPLRPVRRVIGMTLIGLFGSILIVMIGVFVSAALGLVHLDLVHFSGFQHTLEAAANGRPIPIPIGLLVLIEIVVVPFGAIVNAFATIGEELGWRGWLLPSLRPLGTWPALIITGVVWGLWHAPIILLGYDFDQPNVFGLLAMVGGCLFLGILIGWLRLRSGSVWPAVFAHGAFNAASGFLVLLASAGSKPDPVLVGPLGVVPWAVIAAVAVVLALTGQFRRQPRLARRKVDPAWAPPVAAPGE